MQVRWLKKSGAEDVIVVFGGWALGDHPYQDLAGSCDVLLVDDYRDLDAELPSLDRYRTRSLVAFSLGVAGYGHWCIGRTDPFARKVAVNGSLTPVHPSTGIPPRVFELTRRTLNVNSFQAFVTRCYGPRQADFAIECDARKDELAQIAARGEAPEVTFDRIWIGRNDKIFAPANLNRAWQSQQAVIREIDAPHVAFAKWSKWQEVLA